MDMFAEDSLEEAPVTAGASKDEKISEEPPGELKDDAETMCDERLEVEPEQTEPNENQSESPSHNSGSGQEGSGNGEEEEGDEEEDEEGEEEEIEGEEGDWETDGDEDDGDEDDDEEDDEGDDDGSDEEEDSEGTEEEGLDESLAMHMDSDSDAEGIEHCPICLCKLRNQDLGTPESCDHNFCLECIQEWSKNVNTCPVDRQIFHLIFAKHAGEDKVFQRIPVEDKEIEENEEEEEDPTYCEVCGECNREERLLLCDGCDLGYHCECLDPPLDNVPVEEWFCPECARLNESNKPLTETVDDDDEIRFIITENATASSASHPHRMIPRTLASERVRANLELMRQERARRNRPRVVIESEEEVSEDQAAGGESSVPGPSGSVPRPRNTSPKKRATTGRKITKKKTTTTRKKTYKRKTTKRKTTKGRRKRKTYRRRKGGKRKGGKKKGKKVVKKEKPVPFVSVKSRIARNLGLSKPPTGRTIPLQKVPGEKPMDIQRSDIGASSLSILGHKDELIAFQDEEPTELPVGVPSRHTKYSKSALQSRIPLGLGKPKAKKGVHLVKQSVSDSATGLDILGSIMQGQEKLHMGSEKITINRDGSLTAKPGSTKIQNTPEKLMDSKDTSDITETSNERSKQKDIKTNDECTSKTSNPHNPGTQKPDKSSQKSRSPHNPGSLNPHKSPAKSNNLHNPESLNPDKFSPKASNPHSSGTVNLDKSSPKFKSIHNPGSLNPEVNPEKLRKFDIDFNEQKSGKYHRNPLEEDNYEPLDMFEDFLEIDVKSGKIKDGIQSSKVKDDSPGSKVKSKITDVAKSGYSESSKDVSIAKSNYVDDFRYLNREVITSRRRSSNESKESGEISQENDHVDDIGKKRIESEVKVKDSSTGKSDSGSGKKEKYEKKDSKKSDKPTDETEPERSVFKKKGKINISINFRDNAMFGKDEELEKVEVGNIRRSEHSEKSSKSSHKSADTHSKRSSKSESQKSSSRNRDREYNMHSEENSRDSYDVDYDSHDIHAGKMPMSEYPKIPRKKKDEADDDIVEVIVIDDSDVQKPEKRRRDRRDDEYDDRGRRSERDRGKYRDDHRPSSSDHHRKDKDDYRRDREGHRSKERDRDEHRRRHKRDRYRDRSRSHSHERRDRSRSRSKERSRRSRSRERQTRSRSRERKHHSRSRSKERSYKKRRSDRSKEIGDNPSKSPVREENLLFKRKSPRVDKAFIKGLKDIFSPHPIKSKQSDRTDDNEDQSDKHDKRSNKHEAHGDEDDVIEISDIEVPLDMPKSKKKGKGKHKDSGVSQKEPEVSKIEVVTGAKRVAEQDENEESSVDSKKFKSENSDSLIVVKDKGDLSEISTVSSSVIDHDQGNTPDVHKKTDTDSNSSSNIQVVVGITDNKITQHEKDIELSMTPEEYDPACPTGDAFGHAPTPPAADLGLLPPPHLMENLGPPVNFPAHLMEETVGHRLSPLPGQGFLGEGGPIFLPPGERPPLLQQQPQNMGPLPIRFRMFPPGFRPGLPPQQQVIMNPMFVNRPPAFSGFAQLPPGHLQRFEIQVSGPPEVIPIQSRFTVPPPAVPGQPGAIPRHLNDHPGGLPLHPGELPGQAAGMPPPTSTIHVHPGGMPPPRGGIPGQVNGGEFEHMPPEAGPPPPHFTSLLPGPNELLGDPRFPMPLRQTSPLLPHPNHLEPEPGVPMSLPDGMSANLVPISISASVHNVVPNSLPNVTSSSAPINNGQSAASPAISRLQQIQQITKLLSSQHQLALLRKDDPDEEESSQNTKGSQGSWESKNDVKFNKHGEKNVFKVPFPPNLSQSNQKSKSNSGTDNSASGDALKNKDGDLETTEVIDMDMSSPLGDGNIEIADSPEFDSIIFGYNRDKKEGDNKLGKKDSSDSNDKKNKENISKVRFKDDKSSSSGSVTKQKCSDSKKHSKDRSSKEKDRKSHKDRKSKDKDRGTKEKRQQSSSEKKFDDLMNDLSSQDEIPSSAVELTNKEKYLKKLHLQERVVDEVKVALKPFYHSRKVDKDEYKDILRRAVPKVCHSKSGDINPVKIKSLVEAYVEKLIRNKKRESESLFSGTSTANGERLNLKPS